MTGRKPTARITLESLKERNELPIVHWDTRNVWFILGMGSLGGLIGKELGLGLSAAGVSTLLCMYLAYDFVRATPPYANATEWIRTNLRYWRQPSKFANTAQAHVETDSTLRAAVQTSETTRDLTEVSRMYPPHGIVKRKDGGYWMVLRYEPPNMDFSTNEEFFDLIDSLANDYNETGTFDINVLTTTRPVDIEGYFDQLAERMDDPDVQNNEIFKALLQEMKEHRARMLQKTNTETIHVYLIISTDKTEVQNEVGGDEDAKDRSRIFSALNRKGSSDKETKEQQMQRRLKKRLDEKAQTLASILVDNSASVGEANVHQVPATEASAVLETFWTGRPVPIEPEEEEDPVRVTDMTRGPTQEEVDVNEVGS